VTTTKTKTGTREWSEHSVNCCLGCAHGCLYCYARHAALHPRDGRVPLIARGEDWTGERVNAHSALRQWPKYRGVVMFPTQHDITAANAIACRLVLANLLVSGNKVLLVSKAGPCLLRVINRLSASGSTRPSLDAQNLEVRVSLTGLDPSIAGLWEPGAPPPQERLRALLAASSIGLPTSVSVEPCLEPERAADIVAAARNAGVEGEIWIGAANHLRTRTYWCRGMRGMAGLEKEIRRIESWQTPERMREVYESIRGDPQVRWKDSYQKALGIDAFGKCLST